MKTCIKINTETLNKKKFKKQVQPLMKACECSGLGKTVEKAHAAVIRWNIATQQTELPTGRQPLLEDTFVPFTVNLRNSKGRYHGDPMKATTTWLVLQLMDTVLHFREHFRRWSRHQSHWRELKIVWSFWGPAHESAFIVGSLTSLGLGGCSDGILSNCNKPAYVLLTWLVAQHAKKKKMHQTG